MKRAEELIGRSIPADIELTRLVSATCSEFRSSDPALEPFWGAVDIHAGDFALTIYRCDPSPGRFEDRCSAFCAAIYAEMTPLAKEPAPSPWTRDALEQIQWIEPELTQEEELERLIQIEEWGEPDAPTDWKGRPVGEALWRLGSLGTVSWDWRTVNHRTGFTPAGQLEARGAFLRSASGEEFLARVFLSLPWDADDEQVKALAAGTLHDLAQLPQAAGCVERERFADLVSQDMERLRAFCAGGGIVASGLTPKPQSPIRESFTAIETGNAKLACVETDHDWFGVHFLTS